MASPDFHEAIQKVLEDVYCRVYLEVAEKTKLPLPFSKGLLGDPDKILQKTIPPDNPEAEAARRRALGARIKALRRKSGLTQAKVAKQLGIASQSVTNYESGKTEPSIRNLISLAAVLGTSTDFLLGRTIH